MTLAYHSLTVAEVAPLTADSVAVTFDVPSHLRERFDFTPGQHVRVHSVSASGEDTTSVFSVASPAGGPLRIAVRRNGAHRFSDRAVGALVPGMRVDVAEPRGRFGPQYAEPRRRRLVGVAAGSGVAPVLSNLSTMLEREPRSEATLVYANRSMASVMFLHDLDALGRAHPGRLRVVHVLSRASGSGGAPARLEGPTLHAHLDGAARGGEVDDWLVCGPRPLVLGVAGALLGRGVPIASIHVDAHHDEAVRRLLQTSPRLS